MRRQSACGELDPRSARYPFKNGHHASHTILNRHTPSLWFADKVEWMRKETTWAYEQEVAFEHEQARLREENNLEEVSETKTRLRKGLKKAVYALIFVAGCFLAYCMELLFSTFLVAASMRSLLPPTFLARFVKMVAGMLRNLNLDVLADAVEKLMVRDALRSYRTGGQWTALRQNRTQAPPLDKRIPRRSCVGTLRKQYGVTHPPHPTAALPLEVRPARYVPALLANAAFCDTIVSPFPANPNTTAPANPSQ